ncbi:MAG TPA: hypothetical protein VJ851_11600 [Jatrophihabitans sp.]|nr:hypothetical protein [Jatrophihabitans sp.]
MADQTLRRLPPRQRTLLALLLAPIGLVLLVGGVLATVASAGLAGHAAGVLIALIALVLLGIAHGLFYSARQDRAEQRLDAAIQATAGSCGRECGLAGCGAVDCAVQALPRR